MDAAELPKDKDDIQLNFSSLFLYNKICDG